MRIYLLLFIAGLFIILGGTLGCIFPGDAGYTLTVVNQSTQPVVPFVNGFRRGQEGELIKPCTTRIFQPMSTQPGGSLDIRIESAQGTIIQQTILTPTYVKGAAYVTITVPGQCSPAVTPTP